MKVRTRFAPSPTGLFHIGSLRTALYSYAFAKSQGGKFILRIEDTDRRRFVPGATEKMIKMLRLFGLNWDEGPEVSGPHAPYIQSERTATGIYKKYADKLVESGHAYYCFCQAQTKEEIKEAHVKKIIKLKDENCRNLTSKEVAAKINSGLKPAIRLRVPDNEKISFYDFVLKKEISWDTDHVDEVMLLKSDGFPTYHLAVTIDDSLMKISHILRAMEWLPSTPAHLLLYRYLDLKLPQIGHLTDILDPEGGKLSKRKGSVSCEEFLAQGFLPEAILNFIMLLGWAPKDNREIFSLADLVTNFQKGSLQVANPVFNRTKLNWFNGCYLRQKSDHELLQLIKPFAPPKAKDDLINKTIPLVKDRISKLSDYTSFAGFFFREPKFDKKLFTAVAKEQLKKAIEVLEKIDDWQKPEIESRLQELVKKEGWQMGEFFMNFRVAITGSQFTPPITDSVAILGRGKTLARLRKASGVLS